MFVIIFSELTLTFNVQNYWQQSDASLPSLNKLLELVADHVSQSLGIDKEFHAMLSLVQMVNILSDNGDLDTLASHKTLWTLITNQEFLMTFLMVEINIFPALFGTCGEFYAVEHVETFPEYGFKSHPMTNNERILRAIDLVNYAEQLTNVWRDPLHLCDVKMSHFGWTADGNVKFVDIDTVMTETALLDRLRLVPDCEMDEDCSYFDCAAKCEVHTGRCLIGRTNTNLQMICRKIFQGQTGTAVAHEGLLTFSDSSSHNSQLEEALDLCTTNPGMTFEPLLQVLKQAYNTFQA